MSASELRASARQSLKGNWGKGALITLCYTLIMFGVEWILSLIPVVGPIVSIIISVPISYGIIVSFIKLKRGEEVKYTDFLNEGFSNFGKIWGVYGHTILKMIVPVILVIVFLLIIIVSSAGSLMFAVATDSSSGLAAFSGLAVVAIIGYFLSAIYCIVKGLLYSLTNYILYDNSNMTSKEIVEESERLMKGNRGKYIWLELTFIGWMILASFTFGIGLLWLAPYIVISYICFYEALSGKGSNEEPIETTETIEENNPISE